MKTFKKLNLSLFLISLMILISCSGNINKENYDKIRNGMTKAEVESILGKGDSNASSSYGGYSSEAVTYQSGMKVISVVYSNGRVEAKSQAGL